MAAKSANDELADHFTTHTIDILRVAEGQRAEVITALEKLEAGLVIEVQKAAGKSPLSQARVRALGVQTRATIKDAYSKIDVQTGKGLAAVANLEAKNTVKAINTTIGVPLATVAMSKDQLTALAGKSLVNGKFPSEWWATQAAGTQDRFMQQMRIGTALGEGVDKLAARVRGTKAMNYTDGIMLVSKRQAEALVRTSTATVANEAKLATFANNADLIKGVQWLSTLDSRTTPICKALDGKQWSLPDYKPISGNDKAWPGPIAHWGCFLGDAPISSPAGATLLYRRAYSGELITIQTDGGRCVTLTPNHPLLTPAGWVPAGQLNVGQQLICQKGTGGNALGRPQDQKVQTRFSELAEAAAKLCRVFPVQVPVAGPDFHGDGTQGEVCQIWANRGLGAESDAPLSKLIGQIDLSGGNLNYPDTLPGCGHLDQLVTATGTATHGGMGGGHLGDFATCPACIQILGAATRFPGGISPAPQSVKADAELLSDLPGRHFIGDIERDCICVIVRGEAVAVPVHNLETPVGWYLADGIASHNCRSTQTSVLKSWAELAGPGANLKALEAKPGADLDDMLRANLVKNQGMSVEQAAQAASNKRESMDGGAPATQTFEGFLRGKSAEFQNAVLGDGKAKLWRAGEITVTDMTDQQNRPLSLAQLHNLVEGKAPSAGFTDEFLTPGLPAKVIDAGGLLAAEQARDAALAAHVATQEEIAAAYAKAKDDLQEAKDERTAAQEAADVAQRALDAAAPDERGHLTRTFNFAGKDLAAAQAKLEAAQKAADALQKLSENNT